jgi:hypothetical protein
MGKDYTAKLPDGRERCLASFSMGRATLFYEIALLLEKYLALPCGISEEVPDEMLVDTQLFLAFFDEFWSRGWLGDSESSFIYGWAEHAAGLVENITLTPLTCIDRSGNILTPRRYRLENEEEEALLDKRKAQGINRVRNHNSP